MCVFSAAGLLFDLEGKADAERKSDDDHRDYCDFRSEDAAESEAKSTRNDTGNKTVSGQMHGLRRELYTAPPVDGRIPMDFAPGAMLMLQPSNQSVGRQSSSPRGGSSGRVGALSPPPSPSSGACGLHPSFYMPPSPRASSSFFVDPRLFWAFSSVVAAALGLMEVKDRRRASSGASGLCAGGDGSASSSPPWGPADIVAGPCAAASWLAHLAPSFHVATHLVGASCILCYCVLPRWRRARSSHAPAPLLLLLGVWLFLSAFQLAGLIHRFLRPALEPSADGSLHASGRSPLWASAVAFFTPSRADGRFPLPLGVLLTLAVLVFTISKRRRGGGGGWRVSFDGNRQQQRRRGKRGSQPWRRLSMEARRVAERWALRRKAKAGSGNLLYTIVEEEVESDDKLEEAEEEVLWTMALYSTDSEEFGLTPRSQNR